jgi:hypothetical protein
MTTSRLRVVLIHLLPFVHLCACLTIALARLESGWDYMLFIDIPVSGLLFGLSYNFNHPLILYGVIGTLWWYLLSRAVEIFGTRVLAAIRKWHSAQG